MSEELVTLRSAESLFGQRERILRDGIELEKGAIITNDWLEKNEQLLYDSWCIYTAYPDIYLDVIRPAKSNFNLFPYQRIFLRACMRYTNIYITAARATSKTFLSILAKYLQCIFLPGHVGSIVAPNKSQAAKIAKQKIQKRWRGEPSPPSQILQSITVGLIVGLSNTSILVNSPVVMRKDATSHFLVGVDFKRIISVSEIIDLSLAFKNNFNYFLTSRGQNVSKLRIDPGLVVILVDEGLRNLNNRSTTEDVNVTSTMDHFDVIRRVYTLNTSGCRITIRGNRNNRIGTHSTNELRRSKDDRRAISTYSRHQFNHFVSNELGICVFVGIGTTLSIEGSAQSTLNLNIHSIGQTFSHNIHNIRKGLGTIKQSFEVNRSATADSVRAKFDCLGIKTECLINTRQTNLSEEFAGASLADLLFEDGLLSLSNLLNISERSKSRNYILRNDFIDSSNDNIVNVITIFHKLVDRTSKRL